MSKFSDVRDFLEFVFGYIDSVRRDAIGCALIVKNWEKSARYLNHISEVSTDLAALLNALAEVESDTVEQLQLKIELNITESVGRINASGRGDG